MSFLKKIKDYFLKKDPDTVAEKRILWRLERVGSTESPVHENILNFPVLYGFCGPRFLEIGQPFLFFFEPDNMYRTSTVTSVYHEDEKSHQDKLIVTNIQMKTFGSYKITKLAKGEYLFSTINSIYRLSPTEIKR